MAEDYDALSRQIEELEAENARLRAELEGMRKQSATYCIWLAELQERIRELEAAVGR